MISSGKARPRNVKELSGLDRIRGGIEWPGPDSLGQRTGEICIGGERRSHERRSDGTELNRIAGKGRGMEKQREDLRWIGNDMQHTHWQSED